MSRTIAILNTGLTMEASKRLAPAMDTVKFGQMLEKSIATVKDVPNLYFQVFWLDHEARPESPASISALKKLLQQGSPKGGPWDAHFIGAGVKMIPPLTTLFEDIINSTVQTTEGKAKFLFSADGNDHWEVVKRGFPELGMGARPAQ